MDESGQPSGSLTPDQIPPSPVDGAAAPVVAGSRIDSLDTLRGLALLGILVMNIPSFAFSAISYFSPPTVGGFEGADYAMWFISHLLFEQKMMTLFSMLFGAGIVLFARKAAERRGRAIGLHARRMFWLFAIGMVHAYVFWEGDILVTYAICGLIVFPLWRTRPGWLIAIACGLLMIPPVLGFAQGFFFAMTRAAAVERAELLERGEEAPDDIVEMAEFWDGLYDEETGELIEEGLAAGFDPGPEELQAEEDAMLGGFLTRLEHRAPEVFFFQTFVLLIWGLWRVLAVMAIGMALFKLGVLSGQRSGRFYAGLAVAGFGLGVPLALFGVGLMRDEGFTSVGWFKYTSTPNYFASVLVALGWMGVIMLLCRTGAARAARAGLAAVGRMAFTNYLSQTLICSIIFFGWGFGLYGKLSRIDLVPIVLGVWAFQIAFSLWWLKRYRFGPMEWAWRSLTYWRRQPIRR